MRIGVDVGGTNTDAVLMDGERVAAKAKVPTTADVTGGVAAAIRLLHATRAEAVVIGTTHFANAAVQRVGVAPVAAVRLGLPATASLPPMVDWPDDLRAAVGGAVFLAHGGHEFDGREIAPLDRDELRRIAERIAAAGIRQVALSAVFSPMDGGHERRAAELLAEAAPDVDVTRSSEIGRMGLLQRENAAILNAALRPLAAATVDALEAALRRLGLDCPLYVTQNDGTLMGAEQARRFPVLTFASGATNSMRAQRCSPDGTTRWSSTSAGRRPTSAS